MKPKQIWNQHGQKQGLGRSMDNKRNVNVNCTDVLNNFNIFAFDLMTLILDFFLLSHWKVSK